MIWLALNFWWLALVAGGVLAALAVLNPVALAVLRRIPRRMWLGLGALGLAALLVQTGRWIERRAQEGAQEAAEAKADARAGKVARKATQRAETAKEAIRQHTEEVADEVARQMDSVRLCPEPAQPAGVRDAGQRAVEAARGALSAD